LLTWQCVARLKATDLFHVNTLYTMEAVMAISDVIIDEFLKDYNSSEDLIGEKGIIKQLNKRLLEEVMYGELTHDLSYTKYAVSRNNTGNSKNGKLKLLTSSCISF